MSTGTKWDDPSATVARSYYNGVRTYYNWRAATAGTTNASTSSGDAGGSVCPQQWTLPTTNNYVNLIATIYSVPSNNDSKLLAAPLSFTYTGTYNNSSGSLLYESSAGCYWSRTAVSASLAYRMHFISSTVNSQNGEYRGLGLALRCLAKP